MRYAFTPLPIIILAFIALFICFQNYTPGTILSGWDTLHPEFNFALAIKREVFGVFRTYQGLGAVAAHSDMADLPRIILFFLLSPFVPMFFLRYSYIFLNLILGPIGMYYFLKRVVFSKTPKESTIPSFLGALFYILNLGTMQQFIVPLEMFTTQYASLPWLFLFATEYIYNKTHQKRTLLLFSLVTLLSAPMAYAATLWYIYFIAFILYLGVLVLLCHPEQAEPNGELACLTGAKRRISLQSSGDSSPAELVQNDRSIRFSLIKKASILILLTVLINSFWILPNVYFVFNHASEVTKANINKLFSPQAFLYNKEFGNIADIALLKSFLFDWSVYSGSNQFTQLLHPWIAHLKQPFVQVLGFLFAGIAFSGIIYGALKRNKILLSLLPLLFLCLFFLINDNSPTSYLYTFLGDKIPFFKEAFRFPQDKVFGIFTFIFAIYFAAGQLLITRILRSITYSSSDSRATSRESREVNNLTMKQLNNETMNNSSRLARTISKTELAQIIIFISLLVYFMLPAFKGNFISPYMRIKIPKYYFEMFSWFNNQPQGGRIANLPINSLWGWEYHEWPASPPASPRLASPLARGEQGGGFQGAGFIWFGIKQPLLARDFDRWNPFNEQYYREMSYAIYSQNPEALKLVLEKYNIKYILFDKSVIAPDTSSKVLLHKESQAFLDKLDNIEKIKDFSNTLFVYKVKSKAPDTAYVVQNLPHIASDSQAFYEDVLYGDYGNYITDFRHSGNQAKPRQTWRRPEYPESPTTIRDAGQASMTSFVMNLIDNGGKILPNTLKLTQAGVVVRLIKDTSFDNFILPSFIDREDSITADLMVEKNQNHLTISLYPLFPLYDTKERPNPILVKVNLPHQTKEIILSINQKDNFIFNAATNDAPLSLGSVRLSTKSENIIAIYPSTPNEKITPDLSTIKYYVEPCEDTDTQKTFGGYSLVPSFGIENAEGNSFYIFGKNTHLCMTILLSEVINKDLKTSEGTVLHPPSEALLNVTFNYKSNLPLKFCIAKLINGSCQNYSDNRLNQYFGLQKEDIQKLGLQFQLDTTNSKNIEKALYSNLSLGLTYPFFLETLPNDALKKSLDSIGETLSNGSTLILPYSSNKQLSADITKLPKTSGFCPNAPLSTPPLIKKQILENNKDHFIRYKSIDGLSCDHFSYQNLSQNEAYLIAITSRNVKGLPSTLCITNAVSKHCDIYTTLSSYKDFNTDIFLLPPQIKNENGFDVNIGNLGIKKSPSVNDLKSIEIIPIPYKWLTQIRELQDLRTLCHSERSEESRSFVPLSRTQDDKDCVTPKSVLMLPQSFEKGWKAYEVESSTHSTSSGLMLSEVEASKLKIESWLKTFLPFVFGKEIKNHVLVNNWSNGWILENSQLSTLNSQLIIVFLPQYLEYLGFLLLLGTFALLIFAYRPTPKKNLTW